MSDISQTTIKGPATGVIVEPHCLRPVQDGSTNGGVILSLLVSCLPKGPIPPIAVIVLVIPAHGFSSHGIRAATLPLIAYHDTAAAGAFLGTEVHCPHRRNHRGIYEAPIHAFVVDNSDRSK
jgi:hypothetical protein